MLPRQIVGLLWSHRPGLHRKSARLLIILAFVCAFIVNSNQGTGPGPGPGPEQRHQREQGQQEAKGYLENLEQICKDKLDFKSVAEFKVFEQGYMLVGLDELDPTRHANWIKCLHDWETIDELAQLVDNYDRVRPCKFSEVSKLEAFARKHLLNNQDKRTMKGSLTLKFFTLFGVNVGITCKLNMLAHLKQADSEADQLDFIYSMASPTGWNVLTNEYIKKTMKFGSSSHPDSHVINRIARLVPDLSSVDELDYLNFDHPMNENPISNWTGVERGTYELKNGRLRSQMIESVARIIESCNNLDKFYVNSLLSLAKLKELGLLVEFLNDLHEHSALLHKWLVATSFCQLMVRVRLTQPEPAAAAAHPEVSALQFEIIHDDKLLKSRRRLYSYVAQFDDIREQALELRWQANVYEGAWRRKSEAMWRPGNDGSSVAMNQLRQFIKGVEQDFQRQLDE